MEPISERLYEQNEWVVWAACRDDPKDQDGRMRLAKVMFPYEGDKLGVEMAKAVCSGCPVISECLDAALARNEKWGIWGGLDYDERVAVKRRNGRAPRLDQAA